MNVLSVILKVQTKMANVILTLKIMPESPSVDLASLQDSINKEINAFTGETETKAETEDVAFGIKALKITFVMDENKGSTEALENKIKEMNEVSSVDVVDVRRAIG